MDTICKAYKETGNLDQVDAGNYVKTGLQLAVTGFLLTNTPARKAWLFLINNLLFTFEVLFKLRNAPRLKNRLVAGTPTNMKAFHDDPQQDRLVINAPMLAMRDDQFPSAIHFKTWNTAGKIKSDVAWLQFLSIPMWKSDHIDRKMMINFFAEHHQRINQALRRMWLHRPYHRKNDQCVQKFANQYKLEQCDDSKRMINLEFGSY